MPNTLGKNLHLCFSLMKRPHHHNVTSTPNTNHHPSLSTATAATAAATVAFVKNYNSLYEDADLATTTTATTSSSSDTEMLDDDPDITPATPDLAAAYASRRFFISSPGRSNSIVDTLSLSTLSSEAAEEVAGAATSEEGEEVAGGVAVETYSPDPYADFRRSMEEMVAAREIGWRVDEINNKNNKETWVYLQELLLSYLSLNPKNTHKYIVGAFADLVVTLTSSSHDHNNNSSTTTNASSSSSSSTSSMISSSSCGGADIHAITDDDNGIGRYV